MTVYIVMHYDYDDIWPESVWSSLGKAKARANHLNNHRKDSGNYSVYGETVAKDNDIRFVRFVPTPFEIQ